MTIPITQVVAGDISYDNREVLIKNYQTVYYWERQDHERIQEMFARPPQILPYSEEPQGEAITFSLEGDGYFTISEKVGGEKSYLQFYKRK